MDTGSQSFVDPQTIVNENKIYMKVWRWLAFLSLQKAFKNFKCFLQKPTILSAFFIVLLTSPSAFLFHFFFIKLGLSFRLSTMIVLCSPFFAFLCFILFYRYLAESSKSLVMDFCFNRLIKFNFDQLYQQTAKSFNEIPIVAIQALKSDDKIVKFFALKQLQKNCSGMPQERLPLYSLSQPGGHPRNWNALRDCALGFVGEVRDRLQSETRFRTIQTSIHPNQQKMALNGSDNLLFAQQNGGASPNRSNNSSIILNELYEGKQSFFVPPTLKPRSADQFLAEIKQHRIRMPFFVDAIGAKIRQSILFRQPPASTYQILCTILAIQALSKIIANSLLEDNFGIVQKDLRLCLASLARLSIAIDAYVKTIARTDKIALYHDFNLHILDGELAAALKEIRSVFGPYISDLELSPTELEVFRILN